MPQKQFKLGNLSESGFGIFGGPGLGWKEWRIRRSVILVSWGAPTPITLRLYISQLHYFTSDHKSENGEHTKKNPYPKPNIARIANAVPFTLYSRVTMNDEIVVLNCQKCNQCLTNL